MEWYWWFMFAQAMLFVAVIVFYTHIVSKLENKIRSLEASHPFNFDCTEKDSLVNNSDPVAELVFKHIMSCFQCFKIIEHDIKKVDTLRISNSHKELLKTLLEPIKLKSSSGPQ